MDRKLRKMDRGLAGIRSGTVTVRVAIRRLALATESSFGLVPLEGRVAELDVSGAESELQFLREQNLRYEVPFISLTLIQMAPIPRSL